jgi:hypothetical protein
VRSEDIFQIALAKKKEGKGMERRAHQSQRPYLKMRVSRFLRSQSQDEADNMAWMWTRKNLPESRERGEIERITSSGSVKR